MERKLDFGPTATFGPDEVHVCDALVVIVVVAVVVGL